MKEKESRKLLEFLYDHVNSPDFRIRFQWQKHSAEFWDNRRTQRFAAVDY